MNTNYLVNVDIEYTHAQVILKDLPKNAPDRLLRMLALVVVSDEGTGMLEDVEDNAFAETIFLDDSSSYFYDIADYKSIQLSSAPVELSVAQMGAFEELRDTSPNVLLINSNYILKELFYLFRNYQVIKSSFGNRKLNVLFHEFNDLLCARIEDGATEWDENFLTDLINCYK